MDLMEIKEFAALVALADHGTYPKAAASLHVPLVTLRTWVKVAEARSAVRLVRRRGRGIELTEAGAALVPIARRVLELVHEAQLSVRLPRGGHLSIGTVDLAATWVLGHALKRFLSQWPNSLVDVVNGTNDDVMKSLSDGRVRLALVTNCFDSSRFSAVWEAHEPVTALVGTGIPLAEKNLAQMPILLPGEEIGLAERLAGRRIWRITPVQVAKEIALSGEAVLLLPQAAARSEMETGRLHQLQLDALQDLRFTVHCLVKRTTRLAAVESRFVDALPQPRP